MSNIIKVQSIARIVYANRPSVPICKVEATWQGKPFWYQFSTHQNLDTHGQLITDFYEMTSLNTKGGWDLPDYDNDNDKHESLSDWLEQPDNYTRLFAPEQFLGGE